MTTPAATVLLIITSTLLFLANVHRCKTVYDPSDIVVQDLKLFVEGSEFFIKGLCYSPTPLGFYTSGGGGLCTPKRNRQGYWVNGCGDDFFDGIVHPDYVSHGPWWKPVWDRDLPIIKSMGVNTIRIYHMDSYTKYLYEKYGEFYPNDLPQYASDHRPFMDTAALYGLMVVAPIIDNTNILTSATDAEIFRLVEARVEEMGNHSALLMWNIGNEWGIEQNQKLRTVMNKVIAHTRQYMLSRWNRIVPIMTAVIDIPNTYEFLAREMDVDIFGVNAYRELYVDTLWNADGSFTGWKALSKTLGKPLLIAEFGWDYSDQQTAKMPDWINRQLQPIYKRKSDGCIGALFFEYCDESWKDAAGRNMGVTKLTAASSQQGSSTKQGVLIADNIQKKTAMFNALSQGVPSSSYAVYSFSSDVFAVTNTTVVRLWNSTTTPEDTDKPDIKPCCIPDVSNGVSHPSATISLQFLLLTMVIILLSSSFL